MSEKLELTLQERSVRGKAVKALRRQGLVPAVIYGDEVQPQNVMAPQLAVTKTYRLAGKRQPIELLVGQTRRLAMIKSADIDPVKQELRHLAFHVVKRNEKVGAAIPVVIDGGGETPAERLGLVVLKTLEQVSVEALPADLPQAIEAPGEKLAAVGDHLSVADLKAPKGVTIKDDPSQIIATVYEPGALAAANEAAGGEAKTPGATGEDESAQPAEAAKEDNPPQ